MRVVVLMGGMSAERDVSLASGEAICQGLEETGIQASKLEAPSGASLDQARQKGHRAQIGTAPPKPLPSPLPASTQALAALRTPSVLEADVVFLAFHGGAGENGTVQAVLEVLGVSYTGSGVLASALAMDKNMAKIIFQQAGIPTPPWMVVCDASERRTTITRNIAQAFGFPCVVKPNDQGSTVGFSLVKDLGTLPQALAKAAQYSNELVIERYVPGRELTVAILEGEALPVVEIVPKHGVYDYECKYTEGMSEYVVPADIPEHVETKIKDLARRAFLALKCRDYARVDFRLDDQDNLFCLEVNSLPGMTHHSLVPKAAQAAGIEFPSLVARIAKMAFDRSRKSREA